MERRKKETHRTDRNEWTRHMEMATNQHTRCTVADTLRNVIVGLFRQAEVLFPSLKCISLDVEFMAIWVELTVQKHFFHAHVPRLAANHDDYNNLTERSLDFVGILPVFALEHFLIVIGTIAPSLHFFLSTNLTGLTVFKRVDEKNGDDIANELKMWFVARLRWNVLKTFLKHFRNVLMNTNSVVSLISVFTRTRAASA